MKFLLTMNLPYTRVSGGANRSNRALAEGLVQRGHDVRVVVPALAVPSRITHEQFRAELLAEGIDVHSREGVDVFAIAGVEVNAVADPSRLRAYLVEQLKCFAPDWVLVSSEDPSQSLLSAALKTFPERVIYLAHTPQMLPFGPASLYPGEARTELVGRSAAIVVVSRYVSDYIKRWSGFESFINHPPHFGPGPFPNFGNPESGFVLMMNASAIKGLPIFDALARAFPEVQFAALPGYGTNSADRVTLESLPNVTLLQNVKNIDDILGRTRLFLMPSLWVEGFGVAVVDAMLRGIPVLASDFSGLSEAKLGTDYLLPVNPIEKFEDRLDENMLPVPVVPAQDIGPWRDALGRLLSDSDEYRRQSASARRAALDFVSGLSLAPFEELLARLAADPARRNGRRANTTTATPPQAPESDSAADHVSGLTPEQLALLVLQLRKKKKSAATNGNNSNGDGARASAITRRPATAEPPLSFAQQRLWFLDQLEPESTAYHINSSILLSGRLDISALERALGEIVRRHEILRTTFPELNGLPRQLVAPAGPFNLPLVDLGGLPREQQEASAKSLATEQSRRLFSLSSGPLMRACLLRLDDERHVLNFTMHHIISDGWSMGVLAREVTVLYEAFTRGARSPLAELPIQYADFAHWQREWLSGERLDAQLSYWKRQLAGAPALLELPTDRPRTQTRTYSGAHRTATLSQGLTRALNELSRAEGTTLFITLLAAFQTLLSRYSGQTDVVVGSPIANRNHAETEPLIGFFVNTLALRANLSGDPSFRALLKQVRETALSAYAHQDLPFEKVLEELQPERSLSHTPLFQAMFILQNVPAEAPQISGLKLTSFDNDSSATKFDLILSIAETDKTLTASLEYSTDLFDEQSISQLLRHFHHLLEALAAHPDQQLSALPLLSPAERHQLLHACNSSAHLFPHADRPLHEHFEAQAALTPHATALLFEGVTLSYRQLDERANQLAHLLRRSGVGPELPVGLLLERSCELVISLLAVLKSGGAYLPLDPDYPAQRLAFMLEDTRCPLVLTHSRLRERLPETSATLICLDESAAAIESLPATKPAVEVEAESLAYVIFTSGSTGRPKGAMNTHRGIVNRLLWMQQAYQLTDSDCVLQKTPFSFDVSVWEFFWPLMTGARLVIARPRGHLDSEYLVGLIQREAVTTLHFVPSMLQVFLDAEGVSRCSSVRRVIASGEALPVPLAERCLRVLPEVELHNLYGPTEAAVDVTSWRCRAEGLGDGVKLGRAIANLRVYVLDGRMEPAPAGVRGEIYLGGVGVGRGYAGRAGWTAERFVPDPFSGEAGARLYRSGDVGRWSREGELEYLGRVDGQVKVRGQRIELGEVEAVVSSHELVREAAVAVREEEAGDQRLVAYVVCTEGAVLQADELREYARERLPEYMVPQAVVRLERMPLTASGKVERRALPAVGVERPELRVEYVGPRSELEERLARVWAEALGLERVGVRDNFFDAGGHSLLMVGVAAKVREEVGREVTLMEMFRYPTIDSLTKYLEQKEQQVIPLQSINERALKQREVLNRQRKMIRQRVGSNG